MSEPSTDRAWIQWGEQDPYFAVITDPKFRSSQLTEDAKREFFESGSRHLAYVLNRCKRYLGVEPPRGRALDFGCGVGRVAIPMAQHFQAAVGVDVSPAMLAEAGRNAASAGLANLTLLGSDPELSAVEGQFDFVHSAIVFQHIDVPRGRRLFQRLIEVIAPGGFAALQITYGKARHADTFGQPPQEAPPPAEPAPAKRSMFTFRSPAEATALLRPALRLPGADPEMQMNPYPLSELAFIMQTGGIQHFHTEFTDHGGELGVFLFMQKTGG